MVEVDGGGEGARAIVFSAALALVAGIGGRVTDLVTGLAVEEAVVAALSVDGGSTGKADGGVSVELEHLHRHAGRLFCMLLRRTCCRWFVGMIPGYCCWTVSGEW